MKRILFVDDEARVLEALRRSLHGRRGAWDMVFADGCRSALGELERAPFDVIVSDVRMPGMDGTTLLQQVKVQYPSTVRIILSGHSDVEAALRAVSVAHQFLSKPCPSEVLTDVVERACSLHALLDDDAIRRVITGMEALPSQPKVYQEVSRVLAEPNVAVRSVAKLVEQDVAICAKILQLVNSSFFGVPRRLSSIEAAISYLGMNMVRRLVLSVEAFRPWETTRIPGLDFEALMEHSLVAGHLASRLLSDKKDAEDAFLAAMLHDIGTLVLASACREQLASVLAASVAQERPLELVEEEVFGVSHGPVGAYLLGLWGLPYPIVEAVAHHHTPTRVPQQSFGILGAVYVADRLAYEYWAAPSRAATQVREPLDEAYLERLGVIDRLPEWHRIAQEFHASRRAI